MRIHQLHRGQAVLPAPRERVQDAAQGAVQREQLHLAGQVKQQVVALCGIGAAPGKGNTEAASARQPQQGTQVPEKPALGEIISLPSHKQVVWLSLSQTFLQRRQLLGQPVQVLLQEVDAPDEAAVGAEPQLCLHAFQRHQLANVDGRGVGQG